MSRAPPEFQRKTQPRPLGRRVLIACEGSRTEPRYFEGIRQYLRAPTIQVTIVPHQGTDPLTVVQAADDERQKLKVGRRWSSGDTAWAVFDGEEHQGTEAQRERWNTAIQRAASCDIRLAISNPSFELWYLLHYRDQRAALDRTEALRALRAARPGYEKDLALFSELHRADRTQQAVERASRLSTACEAVGWERWRNPSTGVHPLVEQLLALSPNRGGR